MNRTHSLLRECLLGPPKMTSRQLVGRWVRRRRRKGTTGDWKAGGAPTSARGAGFWFGGGIKGGTSPSSSAARATSPLASVLGRGRGREKPSGAGTISSRESWRRQRRWRRRVRESSVGAGRRGGGSGSGRGVRATPHRAGVLGAGPQSGVVAAAVRTERRRGGCHGGTAVPVR